MRTMDSFFNTMAKYQKVTLDLYYMVRDDDESMQEHAKQCLYEDIMNLVKYDELYDAITLVDAPEAREEDIPEFLQEEIE